MPKRFTLFVTGVIESQVYGPDTYSAFFRDILPAVIGRDQSGRIAVSSEAGMVPPHTFTNRWGPTHRFGPILMRYLREPRQHTIVGFRRAKERGVFPEWMDSSEFIPRPTSLEVAFDPEFEGWFEGKVFLASDAFLLLPQTPLTQITRFAAASERSASHGGMAKPIALVGWRKERQERIIAVVRQELPHAVITSFDLDEGGCAGNVVKFLLANRHPATEPEAVA